MEKLHLEGYRYTPVADTWYRRTPSGRVSVTVSDVLTAGGFTTDDLPALRVRLASVETHAARLPQD